MIRKIKKRDGAIVDFNPLKITNAIWQAARAVGGRDIKRAEELTDKMVSMLEKQLPPGEIPHVEQVQDLVEKVLVESGHAKTAKVYILYREKHKELREIGGVLQDLDLVDNYLDQFDWRIKENSNMSFSLQGLNVFTTDRAISTYWLHKIYPANLKDAHAKGDFHIHDLGTLGPYTYYGKEVVVAKHKEEILLTSFELLYDLLEEEEKTLSKRDEACAKNPKDLLVLDRDGWTKVSRVVRKKKHRPMYFVKNRGGRSVIVTDNHPMITQEKEKEACQLKVGEDRTFTADSSKLLSEEEMWRLEEIDLAKEIKGCGWERKDKIFLNGSPLDDLSLESEPDGWIHTLSSSARRKIKLSEKFGYFVGFALAEDFLSYDLKSTRTITLSQKDKAPLLKANEGLIENGMSGCLFKGKDKFELRAKNPFLRFLFDSVFKIKPASRNKTLPIHILAYNREFVKGIIAGILDGDGSINIAKTTISLRISSRTLLEQLALLMRLSGFTPRDRNTEGQGSVRVYEDRKIFQNYPLYGPSFRKVEESLPSVLYDGAELSTKAWLDEDVDNWHQITNVELANIPDDFIYDITTESGTLLVNGMWNHNCVGWDLQDLLLQGFRGVRGKIESKPASHFGVALMQIVNFLYTLQGEAAGAQAFSNFDTLLAPFVRHDHLDYASIKQEMQMFLFNMNVPTRVGFQSLVGQETVIVKSKGKVRVAKIGDLIDQEFERNIHRIINNGNNSFALRNYDDHQVLAFDKQGRAEWKNAKAFIRHGVPKNSEFFELRTSRGNAKVSRAHSMFRSKSFNSFDPEPIRVENLKTSHPNGKIKEENHLIALSRVPRIGDGKELDVAKLIDEVPQLKGKVFVQQDSKRIDRVKEKIGERYREFTQFYLEFGFSNGRRIWRDFKRHGGIRFDVWRKFGENERDAAFFLKSSKVRTTRFLNGKNLGNFVELLAWYLSEGHNDPSSGMHISQAKTKANKIKGLLNNLNLPFNEEVTRGYSKKGKGNQLSKIRCNGLLSWLISYEAGTYSTAKKIPYFIYPLSKRYQKVFVKALLEGDGTNYEKYYDFVTTSKELSLGLSTLLGMLGKDFSVYENKARKENWNDQYTVRIYKHEKPNKVCLCDCEARICSSIKGFSYENEWEYDISVDSDLENFAGGSGLIAFHNSPFTNLTMDLVPPAYMRDQPVMIGGKPQQDAYGDFQGEMNLLNNAFAEVMQEGDSMSRPFSLDYESFCPIKNSGETKLVKLGEFIDKQMENGRPTLLKENNCEVLDTRHLGFKCIGLMNGKLTWQKINYLVRHPTSEVLDITTQGGFNTKATPSHSLLVLKNGKIQAQPAADLREGDYLVLAKALPIERGKGPTLVSLAHKFVEKGKEESIYLSGVKKRGKPYKEKRTCQGKKKYQYKVPVFPLESIAGDLSEYDLSGAELNLAGSQGKIPNHIPINEELAEFLGWYCAEGSAEKKPKYGGISLGLNLKKEKEKAKQIKGLIEKIFKVPAVLREIEKRNLIEVRTHSKLLRRIIFEIFEVGNGEKRKVPNIVFDFPENLKKKFLTAYFRGDGWITQDIIANTISKNLFYGISTLLKQLDIQHTVSEYAYGTKPRYRIQIWNNSNLNSKGPHSIGKIPIKESGLENLAQQVCEKEPLYYDRLDRRHKNTKRRFLSKFGISSQTTTSKEKALNLMEYCQSFGIEILPTQKQLVNGDLIYLKVKQIKTTHPTRGMVYDFSTESETFVANQFVVHNTFPIPTYNITKDFDWEDENLEPVWKMTAKFGTPYFSNFINSDMKPEDARSMCPIGGNEKVLIRSSRGRGLEYSTIRNICEGNSKRDEYEIYSDGKFVKGRFNKFENQEMLNVFLENGHKIVMSTEHLNYVRRGSDSKTEELMGKELKAGMYLPYSLKIYEGKGGNEELGYLVGAYAGDGSLDGDAAVVFSLNKEQKKSVAKKIQDIGEKYFGANSTISEHGNTKLLTLKVHSKAAVGLCRDFVEGREQNKHYKAKVFGTSTQFRKGVIEGHYATDGENRNRIYTSSPEMVETLSMLAATQGTTTSVYKDDREGRLGEAPNHAVLVYQPNREKYGEWWFKQDSKLWVRIKSIERAANSTAYCFEVKGGEPLFTIGTTGVLTHNCRLRLDKRELKKRGGGLFGSNPKTGSVGVVTINMPRIGYLAKDEDDFLERLDKLMLLAKESLEIKREVIEGLTQSGLHPYSKFYLSDIKKGFGEYWKNHFSTIGLIGMNDALLNLMNLSMGDPEGIKFALKILEFMRGRLADFQAETGNIYNLEATPAEGSLAPHEKVLICQSEPKFVEIGKLVDEYMEKNKEKIGFIRGSEFLRVPEHTISTYGFSIDTQKIKSYPVTALVRHPGKSMYEVSTFQGRKIGVTGLHSLFTLNSDGAPEKILVSKLKRGDVIGIPKKIEVGVTNEELNLLELFKHTEFKNRLYGIFSPKFIEKVCANPDVRKWSEQNHRCKWKDTKYSWRKRKILPLKLIYDLNIKIDDEILRSAQIFYRLSKNTKPIKALIQLNEDLGFVIGSLLSEGGLSERSEFRVTGKRFVEKYLGATERTFGPSTAYLSFRERKRPRKPIYTVTLSKLASLCVKELGIQGKSNEKEIPGFIFSAPLACVAGLLRGFQEGDGCIYKNKANGDFSIRLYTNSEGLVQGLNLLLLRFGILAKIRKEKKSNPSWNDNFVLSITGVDNLRKYFNLILGKELEFSNTHSGREVIPGMSKLLKSVMQEFGIKPSDLGICKDSFNRNLRQKRISIQCLRKILQRLDSTGVKSNVIEKLKALADSDIYWDKVKDIKRAAPPKYVYDLEVEVNGERVNNFLGGTGLVCLHNTSYRLAKLDKKLYPNVRIYNQEKYADREKETEPYYTNSSQLPVGFTTDIFEALDLQDPLQTCYTGGTVVHIFLGEEEPSPVAAKKLVRKVAENYSLPYYTLTPTFSICPDHGYIPGKHESCPRCAAEEKYTPCEIYSRVVGYLRPVEQWNKGKQQEFKDRKTFDTVTTKR